MTGGLAVVVRKSPHRVAWDIVAQQLAPDRAIPKILHTNEISAVVVGHEASIAVTQSPRCTSGTGIVALFSGILANRQGLANRARASSDDSDSEVILRLYAIEGASAFRRLQGAFVALIVDGKNNSIFACRDSAGGRPLYYTLGHECLRIASSISALVALGHRPRLNADYIVNTCVLGFSSFDSSFLVGVQQLRPGGSLTGRIDQPQRTAELAPFKTTPSNDLSGTLVENLGRALAEAGSPTSQAPSAVLLSGGMDSAALACAITESQGPDVVAVTLGEPHQADVSHAAAVAQDLKLRHVVVSLKDLPLERYLRDASRRMNGYIAPELYIACQAIAAAVPDVSTLISGQGADCLLVGVPEYLRPMEYFRNLHQRIARIGAITDLLKIHYAQASAVLESGDVQLALRSLMHIDETWLLVEQDLNSLYFAGNAAGQGFLYPYLQDPLRSLLKSVPAATRAGVAGKEPLRTLLSQSRSAAVRRTTARSKVGLPEALEMAMSARFAWACGVEVLPEVGELCNSVELDSVVSRAWWSASFEALVDLYHYSARCAEQGDDAHEYPLNSRWNSHDDRDCV